ncbi:MAG: tetratricopeptide repeat protein, partial [Bacteroidota bacterium]
KARAIREKTLGKEHHLVADSWNNLGLVYDSQGKYEAAEECHKKALAIREKTLGKDHHTVATDWNNLGSVYYSQGNYEAAEECHKKALTIATQSLGKDHPFTQTMQENLSFLRLKLLLQQHSQADQNQAAGAVDEARLLTYLQAMLASHGAAEHKGTEEALDEKQMATLTPTKTPTEDIKDSSSTPNPFTELQAGHTQMALDKGAITPLQRQKHRPSKPVSLFIQACVAGREDLAKGLQLAALPKDLRDKDGNPLVCWMAQRNMATTLEQVLQLGWNSNLPNKKGTYPLHYAALKNTALIKPLLQAGAHPFVQTAKRSTPAQVARKKGKITSLAVLLPTLKELSFEDMAAFEKSCKAYKEHFKETPQTTATFLVAFELALQLGDQALFNTLCEGLSSTENLLKALCDKYPAARTDITQRYHTMLEATQKAT